MEKKQCVSIIIPVLNEQDAIQSVIERIEMTASIHEFVYEVIVVDDNSTDKTRNIISHLTETYPIRLFIKKGKPGKAQSLIEGFSQATYDVICMIDGDLQYPPEAIPAMLKKIAMHHADIVVANRKENRTCKKRKILTGLYRHITNNIIYNFECDVQSGLKVFRKEILEDIDLNPSPWAFDLEFLVKARKEGYLITSHDIIFYDRPVGKSKLHFLQASLEMGVSAIVLKLKSPDVVPKYRVRQLAGSKYGISKIKKNEKGQNQKKSGIANRIIIFTALLLIVSFAFWWFAPIHIPQNFTGKLHLVDILIFILVSYVIWHPLVMETVTWLISLHIKELPHIQPANNVKVAFITTIVPSSESLDLLHRTLPAMVNADYPHDTWLLDEGNSPVVKSICRKYGVMHFSRHGNPRFNTPIGKFTRTKGGNHNSWYEVHGNTYDVVAQIDTDFVPKPNFLTDTLGYFRDPKIAFVGTPQVYGNTKSSFVAKGAAEQLYNFYGPILQGLSGMRMTLLLGANHVIRVKALKDINHYTAHITEDLITGMKLHKNKWKSVYVPYTLAVGEGPFTWEAYFNQQKRWAYGCMDILFHHSPKIFAKMGFKRAIYYFFLQQYYFSGLAMAISLALLTVYFVTGIRAANIDLYQFLLIYPQINLINWLVSIWLQRFHVSWKKESHLLLAGMIINTSAWPIYFTAFLDVLLHRKLTYKVTPKGENNTEQTTPLSFFIPHFFFGAIAVLGIIISFFTHRQSGIMIFWAVGSALLMFLIPFIERLNALSNKVYNIVLEFLGNVLKKGTTQSFYTNSTSFYKTMSQDKKTLFFDCLFLSSITVVSAVLYLAELGFYSDDWAFLGNFAVTPHQTLLALYQTAATPATLMRPVQNIYDAVLYLVFHTQPLGYQIVNIAVFSLIVMLLYRIMRMIHIPRIIALSSTLVFSLLPQYTTDRFWYAAFQVNLSLLFFLLSTYSGLKALPKEAPRKIFWKTISLVSLVVSILSYEVVLPLVLANLFLFWNPLERFEKKKKVHNNTVFILLNIIVLLYLVIFKIKTTTRLGSFNYLQNAIHLLIAIFHTNFGIIMQLPYIVGEIVAQYANIQMLLLAGIIYMCIFFYLFLTTADDADFPGLPAMASVLIVGIGMFVLGYAIFFANNQVGFSPTGIDNRVAIAAAIGMALAIIGCAGGISNLLLPKKYAHWLFCTLIAIVCTSGFLVINTLASFWIQASQQQHLVLSAIQQQFPSLPKKTTLLVDGICPYVGPGVVFESQWDLKGALQTIYHDPTVEADLVTPRLKVTDSHIGTQIYTFKTYYPYRHLYIYNMKYKKTFDIRNENEAYTYFRQYNPDLNNGCPPASAGNGVNVF